MLSPRELRRRIKSITTTAQITRAMEMVAASKMRKAQQNALMTRPFSQLLYRIQRHATTQAREFTHPLLAVRPVRKRAVILIGTDKGLCGSLNTNLFRVAAELTRQRPCSSQPESGLRSSSRAPVGSWRLSLPSRTRCDLPTPGRLQNSLATCS